MTFKLIRKPMVAALALLSVISWSVGDSQTSDAQLFRRLRNRIQFQPPIAPQPNYRSRFQTNTPQPSEQQRDARKGSDPRRVAPVDPTKARDSDALPDNADPQDRTPSARSKSAAANPSATATRPSSSRNGFGNSILPNKNDGRAVTAQSERTAGDLDPSTTPSSAQPNRASLGLQVVESRQGTSGVKVTGINPGSLAPAAGLQVGDLIVSVDGKPIDSIAGVGTILSERNAGENVQVRIVRGTKYVINFDSIDRRSQ